MTAWNTVIGVVPGALPPVIGWCAACGWTAPALLVLFAVSVPVATPTFHGNRTMYRRRPAAAGLQMPPGIDSSEAHGSNDDPDGSGLCRQALVLLLSVAGYRRPGATIVGVYFCGVRLSSIGRELIARRVAYFARRSFICLAFMPLLIDATGMK